MTTDHDCPGPGLCGVCSERAMAEAYTGSQGEPTMTVACPHCGKPVTLAVTAPPVRTTESAAPAGPGTDRAAVEAMVNGKMSFSDIAEAVGSALRARLRGENGDRWCYVGIMDLTTDTVVYAPHVEGEERGGGLPTLHESAYSITEDGQVTLGDASPVVRTYAPAPASAGGGQGDGDQAAAEGTRDRIMGRVVEALADDVDGGRVFRVRVLAYGDSRNGRRYTESVMASAARLYEGARAYDHHRSLEEMQSSTIVGMVGYYRNVEAEADGLYGDLHLLPGATHAAEALDATLAAQEAGLAPLLGVSHDVMAHYRPITVGGRRLQEATAITRVNSADLVADPAAGGQATRMVAGGTQPPDDITTGGTQPPDETKEADVPPTKDEILAALKEASQDELAALGLGREAAPVAPPEPPAEDDRTTESAPKGSWLVTSMVRAKVKDAGLPEQLAESITEQLPDRVVEADVDARISALQAMVGTIERAGLAPSAANVSVTQESREKKTAALDAFFAGNFAEGYRSFRQAWADWTGYQPKAWDEDVNKLIMRESLGDTRYDSGDRFRRVEGGMRLRESADTLTWAQALGDSITRRMVAEYARPDLGAWRQLVSSVIPVADFREQKIDRVGGYGLLPEVAEGAPYQPMDTPTDEEATYRLGKKGGTEDITMEAVANDDIRVISRIPVKLGLAASQTLYRFVFDFLVNNAATSYDSVALFHASHGNTGTTALSQSALTAVRAAMRQQAAYGAATDILSIVPRTMVVPSALEELAWQLVSSAVAIPTGGVGAANTPNIHSRMNEPIVVDYWSDGNDWYTVADPANVPTIEIGFYLGRQEPELWTQSDPSVGSMFDADKITYKIRHIYSGAVLDHRGFYRQVVA